MKKITDEKTLKSIRGGVKVSKDGTRRMGKGAVTGMSKGSSRGLSLKKNQKLSIDDWITELSLALEHYIGDVRESGVYRVVSRPYTIKTLTHYNGEDEKRKQEFLVIDDIVSMYSENLENKYHLHVEKEIDNVEDITRLPRLKVNLSFDTMALKNEVKQLQNDGYRILLYKNQHDNQCLVAINGNEIRYNLEQDFIKIENMNYVSAKDFASKVESSKNDK